MIGGHSHTKMLNDGKAVAYPQMVGGTPVAQAYAYSKYLGKLTVTFDDMGNVTAAAGDPIVGCIRYSDAAIAACIAEMGAPIEEMKMRVVAQSSGNIDGDRGSCRAMECQMGNLMADAMLDRVADQGIEIAIQNGGGLRASIDAGDVTMGEVLTSSAVPKHAFHLLCQRRNNRGRIGKWRIQNGRGRRPFPPSGRHVLYRHPSAEAGSRISNVMVGGSAIDLNKTYGVVSNNYVRNGGDGYKMFRDAENAYDYGPDLADVTAEYMAKGIITPTPMAVSL